MSFIVRFFKRVFGIAEAEVNSAMDALENPIKMTEQGIRDLKGDLNKSIEALASVKAMNIRSQRALENHKARAADYEKKATLLLKRGASGDMDQAEAERLAREALSKKKQSDELGMRAKAENQKLDGSVDKMENKIGQLRSNISEWEHELTSLKSRVRVSETTKKLNKQLSGVDSSSTVARLERMREKVEEQEALAESYGQIADEARSVDDEINKALLESADSDTDDELFLLKEKLGMAGASDDGGEA